MYRNTKKVDFHGKTRMVAHRGASGLETENTASAFIAAANRSYYGIETDIHRTADGKYYCMHDGNTGRICNTDVKGSDVTLEELQALVLRDRNDDSERNDLRICTAEEYRKICERYGKICVPELKQDYTLEQIREIMEIFDGYLDRTCFISFSLANLDLVKQVRPEQECQYLLGDYKDEYPQMLAERGMGVDIYFSFLTEENVKKFHDAGVVINCWTVDHLEDAERLIAMGVDQITTNIIE